MIKRTFAGVELRIPGGTTVRTTPELKVTISFETPDRRYIYNDIEKNSVHSFIVNAMQNVSGAKNFEITNRVNGHTFAHKEEENGWVQIRKPNSFTGSGNTTGRNGVYKVSSSDDEAVSKMRRLWAEQFKAQAEAAWKMPVFLDESLSKK